MRTERITLWTAAIFIGVGIFLLFSIFLSIGNPSSPAGLLFASIGNFFFNSFLYLAFYVPLYFFSSAIILLKDDFRKDLLLALNLGILPFLTLSLVLRILLRPETSLLLYNFRSSFGAAGSGILFILLAILEIVLILQISRRVFQAGTGDTGNSRSGNPYDSDADPAEAADQVQEAEEGQPKFELLKEGESKIFGRQPHQAHGEEPKLNLELQPIEELPSADELSVEDSATGAEVLIEEIPLEEPDTDDPAMDAEFWTEDEISEREEDFDEDADEDELDEEIEDVEIEEDAFENEEIKPSSHPDRKRSYQAYDLPPEELLSEYPDGQYWKIDKDTQDAGDVLRNTLEEFKIQAEVTGIRKGPVITMFEILPAPGVKLSKIVNLSDNIALRLAASSVRIVAPIPGKHAVGIEVPNKKRSIVSFKEMLNEDTFIEDDYNLPIVLGKDITGEGQIIDLTQTPHLLIAGATGSGKSVCVNSIICSLLFGKSPSEVKLLLIDPKIVELKLYNDIPHLITPVVTEPKRAFQALQYCLYEMERRYALLDSLGVRDISSYNKKIGKKRLTAEKLPYIVVVIDEFADLMATSGKELESTLARLAAMSRAVGLHLVLATQRPSIDVITGLIKANIPSRIAFMVAGKFDSRIILDTIGAEKLLGKGDMLFTSPWAPFPVRMQGAFLSDEEVVKITDYVKTLGEPDYIDEDIFTEADDDDRDLFGGSMDDPLIDKAVEIVVTAGKASASYLQRRLKIGYNRAARLVEDMEARGIVGPQNGSKPRDIIHVPSSYSDT